MYKFKKYGENGVHMNAKNENFDKIRKTSLNKNSKQFNKNFTWNDVD